MRAAKGVLLRRGYAVLDAPSQEATHLLLPVPSFDTDGSVKGGESLSDLLSQLSGDVTVIGGGLCHPALAGHPTADLLQDPFYTAQNAAITAHCAIGLAMEHLPVTLDECPVLVIGWGRIGKCLSQLLKGLHAEVTVAARKDSDRQMAYALGYQAEAIQHLHRTLDRYRLIFNTVPAPVLSQELVSLCRADCVKIDLASVPGIAGRDVLWARGLPGKNAPESSGKLIAQAVIRLLSGEETS